MNKKLHKNVLIGGFFATIVFLPGCALLDMFKGGGETVETESRSSDNQPALTGEVLVSIKGRPVITTDILAHKKALLFRSQPHMVEVERGMGSREFERNVLEGLIGQCIADEYVVSNKINELASYKAELEDFYKAMEEMLNAKFFNEKIAVSVSDAEVRSFYETNKNTMQGLLLSPGGIAAQGIEFANPVDARAFVTKVKMAQNNFAKAAQEDGLTAKIKDFKLVHGKSIGIDEMLRDKIVAMQTVPGIEIIEANGKSWVVAATAKEEPKYIPFEQIKDRIKQKLEQDKRLEILAQKIDELRSEYGVAVNEEYFMPAAQTSTSQKQGSAAARGGLVDAADAQAPVSKRLA